MGRNPPHDINVIIEVSVGGEPIRYQLDEAAGTLVVDRCVLTPMCYPGNCGLMLHTLRGDGDLVDVLVCTIRAVIAGAVIKRGCALCGPAPCKQPKARPARYLRGIYQGDVGVMS